MHYIKMSITVLILTILCISCITAKSDVENFALKVIENPDKFDDMINDTNFVFTQMLKNNYSNEFDELKQFLSDYNDGKYSIYDYRCYIYNNIKWINYIFDIPDSDNIYMLYFQLHKDKKTCTWKIVGFNLGITWLPDKG